MKNKLSRSLVVLAILGICAYAIYPTISWYFLMTDQEKKLLDKTPKELAVAKKRFMLKIDDLKKLIPIKYYHIRDEHGEDLVFDIDPKKKLVKLYILNPSEAAAETIFGNQARKKKKYIRLTNEALDIQNEILGALAFKDLRNKIIKLGLDLNGGTHLTVTVDKHDLIRKLQKRYEQKGLIDENPVDAIVREEGIPDESKIRFDDAYLTQEIKKDKKDIKPSELKKKLEERKEKLLTDDVEGYPNKVKTELRKARDNAITVIRNRIDKFGVSEVQLSKGLGDAIFIELPQLDKKKVESTKKTITEAGELVFQVVNKKYFNRSQDKPKNIIPFEYRVVGGEYDGYFSPRFVKDPTSGQPTNQFDSEAIREKMKKAGIVLSTNPSGTMLYPIYSSDEFNNKDLVAYIPLKNRVEVEGSLLSDASVGYDENNKPEVHFEFNNEGATKFGVTTSNNIKYQMAIILDGKVMSAPVIQSQITGRGVITLGGQNSSNAALKEEADQLVAVLKAGVLPAKLTISSAITIGPSLGEENKKAGLFAIIIGLGIVIIFMLYYYRLPGFVAVIALYLNLFLLFAVLSNFGSALTLPGIAGIILTIGMAVDANVIIFERMREEISYGKTHHALIDGAYEKAFSAIFDSNLTTILAAFILSNIGSGVIKGFGTTLMWGIICSMFTALFVTRVVFDFLTDYLDQLRIVILSLAWLSVLTGLGIGALTAVGFGTHYFSGSDSVYQQIVAVVPIKDYLSAVSMYIIMAIGSLTLLGIGLGFIWSIKYKRVITLDLPFVITKWFRASKKDLKV